MNIKQEILRVLRNNPGRFVSGEHLSRVCGCTRAAVWKYIEELREEGYQFEAVRKSGYRLVSAPDVITAEEILAGMRTKRIGRTVYAHDTVVSTQTLAHEAAANGAPEGTLVVAERQTGGKGRLGRAWHSPPGTGIWMSLLLRPVIPVFRAPQLTLLTAVAMAETLERHVRISPQIKWPNDVFVEGRKVCGILTELNAESDRVNYLVIGIGINVNATADDFPAELSPIATSLRIAKGERVQRAPLIQAFCLQFETRYEQYLAEGFAPIKRAWEHYAMSLGRTVTVRTLQSTIVGRAVALDSEGVLIVEDETGRRHRVYSADVEERAIP